MVPDEPTAGPPAVERGRESEQESFESLLLYYGMTRVAPAPSSPTQGGGGNDSVHDDVSPAAGVPPGAGIDIDPPPPPPPPSHTRVRDEKETAQARQTSSSSSRRGPGPHPRQLSEISQRAYDIVGNAVDLSHVQEQIRAARSGLVARKMTRLGLTLLVWGLVIGSGSRTPVSDRFSHGARSLSLHVAREGWRVWALPG